MAIKFFLDPKLVAFLVLNVCLVLHIADAVRNIPLVSWQPSSGSDLPQIQRSFSLGRKLAFLVQEQPLILEYHNGPILSAAPKIPVYIVWYGAFSASQKSIVKDFFESFSSEDSAHPTVSSWWKLTHGYKDASGTSVHGKPWLAAELTDAYTLGKSLKNSDVECLVVHSLATFPKDANAIYLVLTADDVLVEGFCMNSCASHFATPPSKATGGLQLPYAWVGNSASQCPGMCAWPFAKPQYGPDQDPLVAPNADVGMDGIVISLGTILAGTVTNPFDNGFFQGDAAAPLEAASACPAIYGEGSYTGYPGKLLVDTISGASFNVNGINGRKYLVPAIWDPTTLKCTPPA